MSKGDFKQYVTSGTRNENLPPPSWTPTGESGYWVWRDEKWSWLNDEEYEKLKAEENEYEKLKEL